MLTQLLPVKLTETEIKERGRKLAHLYEEIEIAEIGKAAAARASKDRIETLQAEAGAIARVIRSGQEDREVQVQEEKDYSEGVCRMKRLDTGEVVETRAMTPQELQRPLPIDEGEKKGKRAEARA